MAAVGEDASDNAFETKCNDGAYTRCKGALEKR